MPELNHEAENIVYMQIEGEYNTVDQLERPPNVRPLVSIVTPSYNEEANIPILYRRIAETFDTINVDWEWIIVDDHSTDETFFVLTDIAKKDFRIHAMRFSRNFGAHAALTCGLQQARGDCAVIMAADLQDPPESLPALLTKWRAGAQVVWAVRARREGETVRTLAFSRLYYLLMRRFVGLVEMPKTGADFFLVDRRVIQALGQFNETNASLLSLVSWMGFRQETITYDKQARLHGQSGWNLEKKFKLVIDSVTSFTYLPIRLMSYLGFVVAFLGFLYAGVVITNALTGQLVQGWSSLMVVVLVVGGMQMVMFGVLGEYLWRALDESRRRPRYLVEETTDKLQGTLSQNKQNPVA